MKKFTIFGVIALAVMMVFGFVSCGNSASGDPSSPPGPGPEPVVKKVTVTYQAGIVKAGTGGSVSFSVKTENIAAESTITLNNVNTVAGIALGSTTKTAGDTTTVSITTTAATPQGEHPLKLIIDGISSAAFTLTVYAADAKVVTVGGQNSAVFAGKTSTVTFPVSTLNISPAPYSVTGQHLPTGVTVSGQVTITGTTANGTGKLTLSADATTVAGTYTDLTLTIGTTVSNTFTLTISKDDAPTISNPVITVKDITDNGFTITWEKATDDVTVQNKLQYSVYIFNTTLHPYPGTPTGGGVDINSYTFTGLGSGVTRYFYVAVLDEAGNRSVYTEGSATTIDTAPPTISNTAITVSNIASDSFTISWTKATDNVTAQNKLQYSVYIFNTTLHPYPGTPTGGGVDINSYTFTGLGSGVTRYFYVAVLDEAGNRSEYTEGSATTSSGVTGTPETFWYTSNTSAPSYTIKSADQLAGLAQIVNGGNPFSGKTVTLGANVDLTVYGAGSGWTPIGNASSRPFSGTFDGGNHTISNLTINSTGTNLGLFGYLSSATVQKTGVTLINITGNNYIGGIAGEVTGSSTISECYSTGTVSSTVSNLLNSNTGGVAGIVYDNSSIMSCYSSSTVSGQGSNVGGVAGRLDGANGSISNSYFTGTINGYGYIGGIAGTSSGSITKCYVTGGVTGTNNQVGGIAGNIDSAVVINNCYTTGPVKGINNVGGIVGNMSSTSKVTNSYSTGTVRGTTYVGGIAGGLNGGSIDTCYATGSISNDSATGNYIGGIVGIASNNISASAITSCAALNVSVNAAGGTAGRIAGDTQMNIVSNSYAWDLPVNGAVVTAGSTGITTKNGQTIDSTQYQTLFQTYFTSAKGWTYTAGSLPGIGAVVTMPSWIQ